MGMQGRNGSTEMVVSVEKNKLIAILEKNRDEHLKLYKEAHKVWRRQVSDAYDEAAVRAREAAKAWSAYFEGDDNKPKMVPLNDALSLQEPVSHVDEYDRALGMLKLPTGETLTLDMASYRSYVDDEWDWSRQAKGVFHSYTGRA